MSTKVGGEQKQPRDKIRVMLEPLETPDVISKLDIGEGEFIKDLQ